MEISISIKVIFYYKHLEHEKLNIQKSSFSHMSIRILTFANMRKRTPLGKCKPLFLPPVGTTGGVKSSKGGGAP